MSEAKPEQDNLTSSSAKITSDSSGEMGVEHPKSHSETSTYLEMTSTEPGPSSSDSSEGKASEQAKILSQEPPKTDLIATNPQQSNTGLSEVGVKDHNEKVTESKGTQESQLMQWRYRVYPLMQNILYFVTALFFLSGLVQLGYLQWSIFQGTKIDRQEIPRLVSQISDDNPFDPELMEAARLEASIVLESYIVERRYHHSIALLMSAAWIRYLGFSTGMILAVVGASFILGMLREKQTDLTAASAGWKLSLSSSSPGLIMVLLGVILMFTTIINQQFFNVTDDSVYFPGRITPTVTPTVTPTINPVATLEPFDETPSANPIVTMEPFGETSMANPTITKAPTDDPPRVNSIATIKPR